MAKKSKKQAKPKSKRAGRGVKAQPKKSAARLEGERFVRGLIARGEAADCPKDAPLPAGATHRIVKTDSAVPDAQRERFSAY